MQVGTYNTYIVTLRTNGGVKRKYVDQKRQKMSDYLPNPDDFKKKRKDKSY